MVQMLEDASIPVPPDQWAEALKILLTVAEVAGAVSGIGGAVTMVAGLAHVKP
jgi:hypothetical protein